MLTMRVFRCSEDPTLCGYTLDSGGVNLPAQVPEGRRTYFTSLHIEPSQDRVGIDARALVRDVEAHGYHLVHSGVPAAEWQRDTSAEGRNGLMRPDRICRAGTVNYELNRGGL